MSAPTPALGTDEPAVLSGPGVDALAPPAMARRAEDVGVGKAAMDPVTFAYLRAKRADT
jgi:hypothetical protein